MPNPPDILQFCLLKKNQVKWVIDKKTQRDRHSEESCCILNDERFVSYGHSDQMYVQF